VLTRYVLPQVASLAVGPLKELAPDLTIVAPPDPSGVAEVDPIDVQGLLLVDADSQTGIIIVLPPELKAQLVKALTGGVEVASKLPGGLRGLDAIHDVKR
jgi:hypothetical protein